MCVDTRAGRETPACAGVGPAATVPRNTIHHARRWVSSSAYVDAAIDAAPRANRSDSRATTDDTRVRVNV